MIIAPAIVALREGIEAALVIAIMLSYLRKTTQTDMRRYVLGGAVVAVVASLVVSLVLGAVWNVFEGPMLNTFEGVVVLSAALLLTTMIVWMRRAGSAIAVDIRNAVEITTANQNRIGLGLLSFSLVMREGVELVLFSMALAVQDGTEIYAGIGLGLIIAIAIGFGIYRGSLRISLQSLFKWTSVFLILVAAGMIAYGIHELQEAGLLLVGPLEMWNINPPLLPDGSYPLFHENGLIGGLTKAIFGYNGNPSFLEVLGYTAYLAVFSGYYLLTRGTEMKHISPDESMDAIESVAV
ncbi:MAG: hypothetical protein EAX95_11075 [Candidatus Thorarchaeota archaeon]|nr:hypothetical protein [Candidatus Thorarchaeota archaeon]